MMKTIDKMTDQEIYDLTDEQVEKIDRNKMCGGRCQVYR